MEKARIDLDSPRERFFGFWPRRRPAQIFVVLNIIWLALCCCSWAFVPLFYVADWFPSTTVWAYVLSLLGMVLWVTYCKKFWSANEQEKADMASGRFDEEPEGRNIK
jgi:type VI protein secretion system component VasK